MQYYNCKQRINYKLYITDIRYNFYKRPKIYTGIIKYIKSRKYNRYIIYKAQYIYILKEYYVKYIKPKRKCGGYKNLSLKYDSDYK